MNSVPRVRGFTTKEWERPQVKTGENSRWLRAGSGVRQSQGPPSEEPPEFWVGLFSGNSLSEFPKCRQHQTPEAFNSLQPPVSRKDWGVNHPHSTERILALGFSVAPRRHPHTPQWSRAPSGKTVALPVKCHWYLKEPVLSLPRSTETSHPRLFPPLCLDTCCDSKPGATTGHRRSLSGPVSNNCEP